MGILARISESKRQFQQYRSQRQAAQLQSDSKKLTQLEAERSYQEIRAQQKMDIAAEKQRIKELKAQSSPVSGFLNTIKQKKEGTGLRSAARSKSLRGVASQQRTSRPSLFAENNFSSGYRGLDLSTPQKKKKDNDPFSYRGFN